jgi:triosephosphate isomerase
MVHLLQLLLFWLLLHLILTRPHRSHSMVKSIGCEYILCGHSERRTLFKDDDMAINLKVKKVLEAGLKPILCIGETKGKTTNVVVSSSTVVTT